MSGRVKCNCQSCTIRGFAGPAVVITVGVLMLLSEVRGGIFYFGNTWPVILVVIGILHLASSVASREGHITLAPSQTLPPAPPVPPPSAGAPQAPYSSQGQ